MIDRDAEDGDPREAALDAVEAAFIARLREHVQPRNDFDASVMSAVRAEPVHLPATISMSRGRRRVYVASSLLGLALAASVAFLVVPRSPGRAPEPAARRVMTAVAPSAPERTVRFKLVRAGASRVSVAGSFNGWNASMTPLRRVAPDTWEVDVPLGTGRYVYQFVVDGTHWVTDPHAPRDAGEDFGASNSVVTVASGASS